MNLAILALLLMAQTVTPDMPSLLETYRHLHANPELSGQEQQTARLVAQELRQLGFEVTEGLGQYDRAGLKGYGIVGVLKNGQGPVVLIRTDLDALPIEEKTGLPFASKVKATSPAGEQVSAMHACGHDVHMTSFLGTAKALSENRKNWQGTLVMVGQPAEEIGAGARALFKDGLYTRFPKPDFALALHTSAQLESGKIGYCPEFALAGVESVDVTIKGKGGHGAYPHTAKDPIVLAAQFILAIQTIISREVPPIDSGVVTVGSIHGGTKHNIIPDEVKLQLTIRYYKPEIRTLILASIERIAKGLATAAGMPDSAQPIVKYGTEFNAATFNDPELTKRLVPAWQRELGEAQVTRVDPVMGAEDFAYYSKDNGVKGCIFWLGGIPAALMSEHRTQGKPLPSLHSSDLAPDAEKAIPIGIRAMVAAALELFKKPADKAN
ncbi:MAG: amidohydrolase [Acidobacteria bacterium]|nr:MAG: amidohydrolase [Acidobacteriota bacterium]